VAADHKVYIASAEGVVVVLDAGEELKIPARNRFDGATLATPALVDGNIYVRPGIGIFLARVIQPPPTTGNGTRCSTSVLNAGRHLVPDFFLRTSNGTVKNTIFVRCAARRATDQGASRENY